MAGVSPTNDPLIDLSEQIAAVPTPSGDEQRPGAAAPLAAGSALTGERLLELFDVQVTSRLLDRLARRLRVDGRGHYTIGSSGHEANAFVAAAAEPTDPALLHYRSGGFYLARAAQVAGHDGAADVLAGLLALRTEPIAGGRHKVFGHAALNVIPQTSTIGSHLPRAVGLAVAIGDATISRQEYWEPDAIVICSFGDASLNHSTAQGALNAAGHFARRRQAVPVLFVCEDNGIGISVPSPAGWVGDVLDSRPELVVGSADSCDPVAVFDTAEQLVDEVRATRRPAVLHLRCVRFGGHAGTDVESSYRTPAELRADRQRDPIVATARTLIAGGLATPHSLQQRVDAAADRLDELAERLDGRPRLTSVGDIVAPLAPRRPDAVAAEAREIAEHSGEFVGATLAESINAALGGLLATGDDVLVFGEDVGVKGGVYGVTRGLQRRFGATRVFDTLLDEQTILGLANGAALAGFVPIPEIQYLAYVHNAIDQLRGEAATLSFFSSGQYRNGMVVRIAGYGYQRGFGGHFHNDNSLGGLRDIPGVVIASPATADDAAAMLRTCVAAARVDGTVSLFLEPIARYHTRDLLVDGDERWLNAGAAGHVAIGSSRVAREGDDVLLVSWANGLYLSLRAAERLAAAGVSCRVLDLRWLAPLPVDELVAHATEIGDVVIVDETRRQGGVGEAIVAELVDAGYRGSVRRLAAADSFVPLGAAAERVLLSEDDIVATVVDGDHR